MDLLFSENAQLHFTTRGFLLARNYFFLYVITIPTNKPVIRKDYGDLLFSTKEAKYKAIVNEIKERYKKGKKCRSRKRI